MKDQIIKSINIYNQSLDNVSCPADMNAVFRAKDKVVEILELSAEEEVVRATQRLRSEVMSLLATNNYI